MELSLFEKINLWDHTAKSIAELKKEEMRLRKEIMVEAFPEPKLGANIFELNHGYKLKGTQKESVKVDQASLAAITDKFPEGTLDMVVKYEPKLIAAGYKLLPQKLKDIIEGALITKPASPSLELVAPKKEA